jgi:hypothetical protein
LHMEKPLPTIFVRMSDNACPRNQVASGSSYAAMTADGRSAGDL